MKKILVLIIVSAMFKFGQAQEIDMRVNLFGYRFEQNDEKISLKEVIEITQSNNEANLLIKKGRKNKRISDIISVISGVLIAIPINQTIYDKDNPDWTLAYIGGGMALITIPLNIKAFNNINKGIDDYNLSLKSANKTPNFEPEFKLLINGNGLGINMQF